MCCCAILSLIPLQRQHSAPISAPIYGHYPFTPLIISVDIFVVNTIRHISLKREVSYAVVFSIIRIFTPPAWAGFLRTVHLVPSPPSCLAPSESRLTASSSCLSARCVSETICDPSTSETPTFCRYRNRDRAVRTVRIQQSTVSERTDNTVRMRFACRLPLTLFVFWGIRRGNPRPPWQPPPIPPGVVRDRSGFRSRIIQNTYFIQFRTPGYQVFNRFLHDPGQKHQVFNIMNIYA